MPIFRGIIRLWQSRDKCRNLISTLEKVSETFGSFSWSVGTINCCRKAATHSAVKNEFCSFIFMVVLCKHRIIFKKDARFSNSVINIVLNEAKECQQFYLHCRNWNLKFQNSPTKTEATQNLPCLAGESPKLADQLCLAC